MERNIKVEAITLKKIALGESNIGITLLTERDEVIFVMAFGAAKPKNKLFGGVNPFVIGSWDLYFDPVKEYWRAKDVTVITFNDKLQTNIESFFTASLFAEITLKSQGSEGMYGLLIPAIDLLQNTNNHRLVLIQFILRLLNEQGILPSFTSCSQCGIEVNKEPLYYTGMEELVCNRCFKGVKIFEINPGIAIYCSKTPYMPLEQAVKIGLELGSQSILKDLLITIIKIYTGGKLLTLNSANGLI